MYKILHVLDKLSLSSGVSSVIMNLYRNIDKQKLCFHFLVHEEVPTCYADEIEKHNGKVFVVPPLAEKNTLKYLKELNLFFRRHNDYDIIHGHIANASVFYLTYARVNGIKHRIIHSHSTKPSQNAIKKARNYILQIPLKLVANHYVACSEVSAKYLFGENAYKSGKVFVSKNAIDAQKYAFTSCVRENMRKELNLEGKLVIGHIGRFSEEKNHSFLLKIFKEVYRLDPKAVLLLVGDGILEERIKQQSQEDQIEKAVIFLGKRSDIDFLLQAMDAFILPSLFEGLPLSVLEAQASGLKCYISDNITKEVNITRLVEYISLNETPRTWAEKILNSGGQNNREDQYKRLINLGYDIKTQTILLERYYMSILNKGNEEDETIGIIL